ncbi:pyridoxal phosphate-dependent aminotransferase [Leptospira ilyithenensis]|uniref:Pyridoxal phosphate-dependent aminotransferase n=1 Tax=Leptospira ilyithenensis TaxID=2484901 RepID=A0A4R9LSC3_9LEPT|nr:pyridoxal phosphate-dependent aminotransferase [Leptospira ilyithenensis]TGN11166.1 pyridoxal phosphate-dependent aminotransferase [Leptospira ilyithenensis]
MKVSFSKKINDLGLGEEENLLSRIKKEKEKNKTHIIDLTISNPTQVGLDFPSDVFSHSLEKEPFSIYDPNPQGLLTARNAIAKDYRIRGSELNPNDLVLTSSTSEAYSFLFKLLCNPGDEILVPAPGYPLFHFLGELENVEVNEYDLLWDESEKSWEYSLALMQKKLKPSTKAVLLVSPSNPTGSILKERDWQEWFSWSEQKGIPLILDEVFASYIFEENKVQELNYYPNTSKAPFFVLNGISKMLALPQMKLSWIHVQGDADFREKSLSGLEIIADTFLSVNTPIQYTLNDLFSWKSMIQNKILSRVRRNLKFAKNCFEPEENNTANGQSAHWTHGKAGWYGMVEIKNSKLSDEEFAEQTLSESNIYMHPGNWFGFPEDRTVLVVSLIVPEDQFQIGIKELASLCKNSKI